MCIGAGVSGSFPLAFFRRRMHEHRQWLLRRLSTLEEIKFYKEAASSRSRF